MKYTSTDLPPMKSGSGGIAYPKKGPDVAACRAPADAEIARPPSWGEGQCLQINKDVWHIAQDGAGDSYPNLEFETFYEVGESLGNDDLRVAFLKVFWGERGYEVDVIVARKVRPALVVGVISDEAVGNEFENHEGKTELSLDGLILQSPDDEKVRWFITRRVFEKKYQGVTKVANK